MTQHFNLLIQSNPFKLQFDILESAYFPFCFVLEGEENVNCTLSDKHIVTYSHFCVNLA